jgi:hypothetical protein
MPNERPNILLVLTDQRRLRVAGDHGAPPCPNPKKVSAWHPDLARGDEPWGC